MSDGGTIMHLIGIAGPSCSGKTTVARLIAERLEAPLLHLDRYWIDGCEKPIVEGHPSYERPYQYDSAAMIDDVRDAMRNRSVVVAEGFLLFHDPWFVDNCTMKMFLDVPHERLAARRRARSGISLDDVSGGRAPEADAGWTAHGRSEWERFGAWQRDIEGMTVIRRWEDGGPWPDQAADISGEFLRLFHPYDSKYDIIALSCG